MGSDLRLLRDHLTSRLGPVLRTNRAEQGEYSDPRSRTRFGASVARIGVATADEDLATAQARAQEAEHEAQGLYAGGKTDFLPLLDAERSLAQADAALATSHAEIAADQVAIFLALGGGWE